MNYVLITKWSQKDNNPDIWWRSLDELFLLIPSVDQVTTQKIFNFIESSFEFQSALMDVLEIYHRVRGPDNNVYSCLVFESLVKKNEFEVLRTTEVYRNYCQARDELLNFWNIEMIVSDFLTLDVNLEQLSTPEFLMNTFNENYPG